MNNGDIKYIKAYDKDGIELASYDVESDNNKAGVIFAAIDKQYKDAELVIAASPNDVMNVTQNLIQIVSQETDTEPLIIGMMIMETLYKKQRGGNKNDKEESK